MTSHSPPVVRVSGRVGSRPTAIRTATADAASDVRVLETGPAGLDSLAPLLFATRDGETTVHAGCTPADARTVVAALEAGDRPPESDAVVEHAPAPAALPIPDDGPLSAGRRTVLSRCGWTPPTDVDAYRESAFVAETAGASPHGVLETIRDLGLRGRGRGDAATDEPVASQWATARDAPGDPVVVVNANEADERVQGDRLLVESAPLAVLDAARAVAGVVGASSVVTYCNEDDAVAIDRVREAADALDDVVAPAADLQVVAGPDEYVAGEETMALEAMEGADRLEARVRPPGPATHGLYGRPTVVHTPRTLAQVREALVRPEAFDPDDADPGTRLVTVSGTVDDPVTVELATGSPLERALEAVDADPFKLAVVGGQFGGVTRDLDVPASAPALRAADLGTDGAVELFDEGACPLAVAGIRSRFARDENCGRCVPCREGSKQLTELLRDVYDGDFRPGKIRELTRTMDASSTCEFGRAAARPVATALDEFEREFAAHADGRCPSGACRRGEP